MTLKKRLLALCMAVVMVFSLCSISAFAAAPTDDKQPVVIGRYDAPLSECLEPGMAMQVGIANVRVNSYATYDMLALISSSMTSPLDSPGYILWKNSALVDIATPQSMQMQGNFWSSAIRVMLWLARYFWNR